MKKKFYNPGAWQKMPNVKNKMQMAMDRMSHTCDNYDLKIGTKNEVVPASTCTAEYTANQPSLLVDKNEIWW